MRATPICRSFAAARLAGALSNPNVVTIKGAVSLHASEAGNLLCLGSRCSMWHARNDNTPAQNLGCCAENKTAVPWADPAVKENK